MRFFQALVAVAAGALVLAFADDAHAQKAFDDDELDGIGPVRIGEGYSKIFHSPVVAMSFEDEFTIMKLGKHARLHVLFGVDGYDADLARSVGPHRSFMAVDAGAGINFFLGKPLVSISATLGPGYTGGNQGFFPDGFGFAERVEFFPFYRTLMESIACEDGWFSTWVLSGLSVWGEARQDFFGTYAGNTLAAGVGVDLARNALLPIMHKIFTGRCGLREH